MRRRAVAAALVVASSLAAGAQALERADFRFAGKVVGGAAGDGRVYVFVGGEAKAPRRLLELRWTAEGGKLTTLAADLPATTATVVAMPASDGGGALVADGRRVFAIDAGRREVFGGPGILIVGDGDDDRIASRPPWLAAGGAGEVRRLTRAGDALQAGEPRAVPVEASLQRWGLHLESPEARFVGDWLAVGPAQEGVLLRTVLLGPGGERQELTSELPEPERVADSTVVVLDGRPTLVVGSFRGLGVMSRKRLRVFALVGEPGAAPRRPLLARELSARAWQELQATAGDFDGDGRDDLAIAAAEGLRGGEVTVTLFRGMGGGRLRAEPLTASFPADDDLDWRYGADVDGDGRPDLVTLGGGKLAVHSGNTSTGVPARKPTLQMKVDGTERRSRRTVEVSVGTGGARTETGREGAAPAPTATPAVTPAPSAKAGAQPAPTPEPPEPPRLPSPRWELVDVDGDRKAELLWWAPDEKGETHVILLRFAGG
ncbi:MAG TPA: FG-GAP-like repeat-containing protein [Thermoanaerobaculia bacterium]|nr:FG-GAP-like repeat-containing protein [Thermoanaerobaculia bacterium]